MECSLKSHNEKANGEVANQCLFDE